MTPTKQNAQLNGVNLAYFDTGAGSCGRVILLIHGFASNASVNWAGTGWVQLLIENGYRVISIDNRGHGDSEKFYSPDQYGPDIFACDALKLLDYLDIHECDVMGYSMGARITCWLCHQAPGRFRKAVFGGMGANIYGNRGGYEEIAQALEADDPETITDPGGKLFRKFSDAMGSDRLALAACIRPSKNKITPEITAGISVPVLVAVGNDDEIGGSAEQLANDMPHATSFSPDGLDHMKMTGASVFKKRVLRFLMDGPQ